VSFKPKNPNVFQVEGNVSEVPTTSPISVRCPHCRQLGTFSLAQIGAAIAYPKLWDDLTNLQFESVQIQHAEVLSL